MTTEAAPVTWDLSELYKGIDDPSIDTDLRNSLREAVRFEERYRGEIASAACTAETLRNALVEYEALARGKARPGIYSSLVFSADTSEPAHGALLQKMRAENTAIAVHLLFFPLELGRMPSERFNAIIGDPQLAPYRHYLEHERRMAQFNLSEPEEKIVAELSNTGSAAFGRLFSEVTSRAVFQMRRGDEIQEMNQSQLLALLYDPDREVRAAAAEAFTAGLKGNAHLATYIYNTLLQEKATMDRLRGFDYPEQARHEDNEVSPEVVQQLVDTVAANYGVVDQYYRLKGRLLGLDQLTHIDRYAPIDAGTAEIPFEEARSLVLDAFAEFDPRMREMAEPFFTRRWIDAEVRPGKRGGAFCSMGTPDHHPYVFMNYTSRPRDVMTLAHELGHALHAVLARDLNFLEFHAPLPLAETASVFGEMLVFERLQARLTDPKDRLALLCGKIEDTFATVFRQVSMYRFEQDAHAARRGEGELTSERFNSMWQANIQAMFGDSLRLGDDHAWWWMYIPHLINTPFYVYAYAFGELLVLALYARYRQEGRPFVQRYYDLLAAGGSRRPEELLAAIGIDIRRKEFWQGGVDLIRDMVRQAGELASA